MDMIGIEEVQYLKELDRLTKIQTSPLSTQEEADQATRDIEILNSEYIQRLP